MSTFKEPELGTVVHGRDIGRTPDVDRFKFVECYNVENNRGCRERRWALYKGPTLNASNYRLCVDCNKDLSRRFMKVLDR